MKKDLLRRDQCAAAFEFDYLAMEIDSVRIQMVSFYPSDR